MINPVTQSFVANVASKQVEQNKETKASEATKVEDKKVKIAKQLENGEYKLDLKATAQAVTDALL